MRNENTETPRRALNARAASQYLGLSLSWLKQARKTGEGPRCYKVGRIWLHDIEDLDGWLDSFKGIKSDGQAS